VDIQTQPEAAVTEIAADAIDPAVVPPAIAEPTDVDPADFYADDPAKTDALPAEEEEAGEEGDDQGEQQEAEPIDTPLSWAKDAKDVFAKLPREAQEIIATRERERESSVQAKFREAAGTRHQVETEARTALQTIMTNHVQQLQQYAQQIDPIQPDLRLLGSDDPAHRTLYFQQEAAYREASAQRESLTQQMQEAQRHAEAVQLHQQQAELQAEHQLLEEKLGQEWSDPSSRAKLLGELTPIAAELGYPQELIAQARAPDILAMKVAATWKAKAQKFDELNKAKMIPVRAARGIPPTARTAAPTGHRAPVSVEAQMYPEDVRRN
jgi:hypothetical protein